MFLCLLVSCIVFSCWILTVTFYFLFCFCTFIFHSFSFFNPCFFFIGAFLTHPLLLAFFIRPVISPVHASGFLFYFRLPFMFLYFLFYSSVPIPVSWVTATLIPFLRLMLILSWHVFLRRKILSPVVPSRLHDRGTGERRVCQCRRRTVHGKSVTGIQTATDRHKNWKAFCTLYTMHRSSQNPHIQGKHHECTNFQKKSTVKLVYKDQPRDQQNVVLIHRWSLYRGRIAWKVCTWGPVTCGLYK